MDLCCWPLLADENIHPDVVAYLEAQGFDVTDVKRTQLAGSDDSARLRLAFSENRVALTHDSDFGALAISTGAPIAGIVYLRPGHIAGEFTIGTISALLEQTVDVTPPFIVVVSRRGTHVAIKFRQWKTA